jgi:hypothetical protein
MAIGKDGWDCATLVSHSKSVSPQANKKFGPGMEKEATTTVNPRAKERLGQAGQPKKGSNDIAHAGTASPIGSPSPTKGNRPVAWPPSHQKA